MSIAKTIPRVIEMLKAGRRSDLGLPKRKIIPEPKISSKQDILIKASDKMAYNAKAERLRQKAIHHSKMATRHGKIAELHESTPHHPAYKKNKNLMNAHIKKHEAAASKYESHIAKMPKSSKGSKTKSTMSKVPTKAGKSKTKSTMAKVPKGGAGKTLHTAQKKQIKQTLQGHSQKMVFHQKQSERMKAAGAHEASHPQHAKYQGHMAAIQTHKQGVASASRKLAQHVGGGGKAKGGRPAKKLSQHGLATIARMSY